MKAINKPGSVLEMENKRGLFRGLFSFINRFNIPNISEFYGSTEGNSNILNFDNTVGAVGFVPVLFSSILPLGPIKVDEEGRYA